MTSRRSMMGAVFSDMKIFSDMNKAGQKDVVPEAGVMRWRLALAPEPTDERDKLAPRSFDGIAGLGRWLVERFKDEPAELMSAVYLDLKYNLIGYSVIYRGAMTSVNAEPRAVLATALLCNAARVVIHHTHPAGADTTPSPDDIGVTDRMWSAAEVVGVNLVDHIITTGDQWVSLAQKGLGPWGEYGAATVNNDPIGSLMRKLLPAL